MMIGFFIGGVASADAARDYGFEMKIKPEYSDLTSGHIAGIWNHNICWDALGDSDGTLEVARYLRKHPEKHADHAFNVIYDALKEEYPWPCK